MHDGTFKMDVDDIIDIRMYNFSNKKFESVSVSVEHAGLMLGAMLAPLAKEVNK